MKKRGLVRINNKLQQDDEICYNEPEHDKLYGYGVPITINAAREIIKNFWDNLINNGPIDFNGKLAFTFGKETLLSLLSQEGCEGIRFYFAMKSEKDWPQEKPKPPYWVDGITLVAVGVNNQKEIGAKNDFIIENIDTQLNDDDPKTTIGGGSADTCPPFPGSKAADITTLFNKYKATKLHVK
jgi:hypothetical protein